MAIRGAHHGRTGGLTPRKTAFDMSFEFKGTCELGVGVPTMCEEVYPGDFWDLKVQSLIRFHPQVAPLMHEVNVTFHDFFVPCRIIWDDWEEFITGGARGTEADDKGLTWPTINIFNDGTTGPGNSAKIYLQENVGTLWDYIYGNISHFAIPLNGTDKSNMPIDAPLRVYWMIWNEYYRDENFQPRKGETVLSNGNYNVDLLTQNVVGTYVGYNRMETFQPFIRSWTKDYFTSALPFQQRGTAPAFPITIDNAPVVFDNTFGSRPNIASNTPFTDSDPYGISRVNTSGQGIYAQGVAGTPPVDIAGNLAIASATWANLGGIIPGSLAVGPARVSGSSTVNSFDVNYLRYAVQIQKILERNARGGVRYNEWLYGHFGDRPRDERLQRPEYIGGSRASVSVSEVLQTSASDSGTDPSRGNTPQGTMAGHAISANGSPTGKYRVHEHGYIMRIMTIMPTPSYEDGIERMWFRRNRYDYLMPELVNLSEQAILNQEIFASGTSQDTGIWGYQPQYDELRIRRNRVSGELRVNLPSTIPSLGYWHLGRAFNSLPTLGASFIQYDGPNLTNRIMAVSGVHPVIFSVGNIARAVRPLPYIGEPGLVDHH